MTPVSPELVLVGPPELADRARSELPAYPPFPPISATPAAASHARIDRGLATFCLVCLIATLTPFALALTLGR